MSQLWLKTWKSLLIEWCWPPVVLIFTPCLQVWNILVMGVFKMYTDLGFFFCIFKLTFTFMKWSIVMQENSCIVPDSLSFIVVIMLCVCVHYMLIQFYPLFSSCTFIFTYVDSVYLLAIYNSFLAFYYFGKKSFHYFTHFQMILMLVSSKEMFI